MNSQSPLGEPPMNSPTAFRLRLFGSPTIVAPDGAAVRGPVTHRHRVALLALLARAPGRRLSRDAVMGNLWPEREAEHARQLLNQAVYQVRRALGDEALASDAHDLRLNVKRVGVDVLEFEAAREGGDHALAVTLYAGPFLDGFFLSDAPEFDAWAARERERLAAAYGKELETLAEAAEGARDVGRAAELWTTRAAHDPLDSRVALRLARALAASGNRAGALQHARLHERLLREELGIEGPPELTSLVERLHHAPVASADSGPDGPPSALPASDTMQAGPVRPTEVAQFPDQPAPASAGPPWRARAVRYGAVALLLVAALFGGIRLRTGPADAEPRGTREPSIAILPLANLSGDAHDAVLANGMTEELIATLARAGAVRVIASTSTAGFRGQPVDVRKVADSLGVSSVLEGAFRKVGERLRVELRLVDGRDGSTRWAEAYDREFNDIFAVEDEIARAVAGELGMRFDRERQLLRHRPRSVAAYELYLRGSDPALLRSQAGIWKAQSYFQQAIAADSTYAAAHAGLALVSVRRARTANDPGMPPPKLLALADASARRAVALDDSLAEAHYAVAVVSEARLAFPDAERHIRRAIVLDPTRSVYRRRLSYLHSWFGRPEEELAEARRALETDPLNPYAIGAVASGLYAVRRYDESLAQKARLAAIRPPLQAAAFGAAQCYAKKRMWPEAIAALRPQAEAGDPMFIGMLGHMLARAGERQEAGRILAGLLARRERTGAGAFQIAMVHAGLGDLDQTFAWLDRSVDDHSIGSVIMGPTFDELHGDPRFARLRARLGLPPWRRDGRSAERPDSAENGNP